MLEWYKDSGLVLAPAVVINADLKFFGQVPKKEAVWWKAAIFLGVSGAAGAVIGATIATTLVGMGLGWILSIAFGSAIIAGALRMLTAKPPEVTGKKPVDNPLLWILWGIPLGIVTGIIGIGGGVLMIPVMVVALSFRIHRAVGTSTALMIFTASVDSLATSTTA